MLRWLAQGMDPDFLQLPLAIRSFDGNANAASAGDDDEDGGPGAAALGLQLMKGASMAGKFMAKWGKKIGKNVAANLAGGGAVRGVMT